MKVTLILGLLAAVVNLAGYVPYIRDILRGSVRPQRVTWGIWMILTGIVAANQIRFGGGYSAIFMTSTTLLVTVVFVLSLRRGMGGASRLDVVSLVASLILLAYWVLSKGSHYSTYIALLIDAIAMVPTLVKTYRYPGTESYSQWVCAGAGGLLSALAVPQFSLLVVIYPVYIFLGNGAVVATKFLRERVKG